MTFLKERSILCTSSPGAICLDQRSLAEQRKGGWGGRIWYVLTLYFNQAFLSKVGLDLVTSYCVWKTACWRHAWCWLEWGSMSIGKASKAIRVAVGLKKHQNWVSGGFILFGINFSYIILVINKYCYNGWALRVVSILTL